MNRVRWLFIVLVAVVLALAPALADARAGGGGSQGSRGSRTYQSNQAQPMQRSTQPQAAPSQQGARPGAMAPGGAQPSFFQRNPFLTGMLGGLLGAGLFGMLFGGAFGGLSGFAGALGLLLQLALIAGLAYLALRIWRSMRQPAEATAGVPGGYARMASPMGGFGGASGGAAAPAARSANPVEIPIAAGDYDAWSALLVGIQDAWSRGELIRMRQYVTPEMLGYFSEQLSDLASRGMENRIESVELLKGDVEEAWSEGDREYVTARLTWKALDYTTRLGSSEVVEGSRTEPTEATEVWTFVRSRGGNWILSAIQQA
jgi:predicted lipid-binding transport protein (Tim44 family)